VASGAPSGAPGGALALSAPPPGRDPAADRRHVLRARELHPRPAGRPERRVGDAPAAGHLHSHHREPPRRRALDEGQEPRVHVAGVVELRAADHHRPAGEVARVEVRQRERNAVRAHDQIRARQERRVRPDEPELHRPVRQPRRSAQGAGGPPDDGQHADGRALAPARRRPGLLGRAEDAQPRADRRLPALDLGLVERLGRPLLDGDRALGTLAEARPEAVAVDVADEPRLPVHERERALVAGRQAVAAAVAERLVDADDLPRRAGLPRQHGQDRTRAEGRLLLTSRNLVRRAAGREEAGARCVGGLSPGRPRRPRRPALRPRCRAPRGRRGASPSGPGGPSRGGARSSG